ncbi:MAG: hypothetical protein V3V15_01500 [Sphingorhabdus sp.]
MAQAGTITAWILLIFGFYSLGAAIGELRRPGGWARVMWEVEQSNALQFLIGFVVLVLGALVYLVNPYNPSDWQSILVTLLGGLMMAEGIAFLAFPDWIIRFSRSMMNSSSSIWAWLSLLIGAALILIGYVRLLAS